MYSGEGEAIVRETFRRARAASPSIVLLDEVDAIACSYFPWQRALRCVFRFEIRDSRAFWVCGKKDFVVSIDGNGWIGTNKTHSCDCCDEST